MTNFGLLLIILAWGIQLRSSSSKIQLGFVISYALGAALLAIAAVNDGVLTIAGLNIITAIFSIAVLWQRT